MTDLELALADLPGVVYRCRIDPAWTMLALSENVRDLTGYGPEHLVDSAEVAFASLIHPDDRDRVAREVGAAVDRDAPYRVAYRIVTRAGEERWVLEQGRATGVGPDAVLTGYLQDISDSVQERMAERERALARTLHARRQLELLQAVTAIANEHEILIDALVDALPIVCRSIGFDVGRVFTSGVAEPVVRYQDGAAVIVADGVASPSAVVERARAGGRVEWRVDVSEQDAGSASTLAGELGTVLAIPIMAGAHVPAVLELGSRGRARDWDPEMVSVLEQVGIQLGRVWERERTHHTHRVQERRFRQLLENLDASFLLMGLDGRVLYLSPGFESLTGCADGVADREALLRIVHPDDRARVETIFTADPGAGPYVAEFRVTRPDGETRWIRQRGFPIRDGRGRTHRAGALLEDVTQQRAAADRLAETTRFLERLVTNLSEAVLVVGNAEDPRVILEVNRAAELIFGWTREELVGARTDMLHEVPDAYARFGSESEEVLRRGEVYRSSVPMRRKDGSVFEALQTMALLDPAAGLAGGAVSVVRDVSDQARAERRLRESEERFRQIAEHIQDVFWVVSADAERLEYVSPAYRRVWGRDPRDLLEGPDVWIGSVHPDDIDRVREALPRQTEGGYEEEYRIVTPDGRIRWIWDRAYPVRDESGRLRRVIGVAGDVTDRRLLEDRLRQAQKMEAVGRLAGGVAHDFNNLLTVIVGQSDLLLLDLPPSSDWAEDVELIRGAAERGAKLTKQLLAFSREQVLQPRILEVGEVVRHLERLLGRLLGSQVELVLELAEDLPPIRVDPTQLEQVIVNLAANARDAMPEGGTFTIATATEEVAAPDPVRWPGLRPGRYVRLTVSDTGVGMDERTRMRVFEPFFTTRRDRGGTGLGLATSYGIVKQSGGSIHVESEPDLGSTFTVRFTPEEEDGRPSSGAAGT